MRIFTCTREEAGGAIWVNVSGSKGWLWYVVAGWVVVVLTTWVGGAMRRDAAAAQLSEGKESNGHMTERGAAGEIILCVERGAGCGFSGPEDLCGRFYGITLWAKFVFCVLRILLI